MQKSEILIEQDTLGAARPVAIALEVPVSVVLPRLVDILQLPKSDLFGNPWFIPCAMRPVVVSFPWRKLSPRPGYSQECV
ncbi:hypothetical protein KDW_08980 [Dictyobacter vulcani]|uniref:Uncharacterized protein n=1 Tax=Dictyobacter vulcani TaxID=2607529 RepID=A0A5J4KNH0_9CHLR|nr:hypothetical protein KDW_08980 [Dictyobacter vulcani]